MRLRLKSLNDLKRFVLIIKLEVGEQLHNLISALHFIGLFLLLLLSLPTKHLDAAHHHDALSSGLLRLESS